MGEKQKTPTPVPTLDLFGSRIYYAMERGDHAEALKLLDQQSDAMARALKRNARWREQIAGAG